MTMTTVKQSSLYEAGGQLLRAIRESKSLSQDQLVLAMVEQGKRPARTDISKVETGKLRPSAKWLEAALKALDASYQEYQDTMNAFFHPPRIILPGEADIQRVKSEVKEILDKQPQPAYLIDWSTRILDWNDLFARLSPRHSRIKWFQDVSMTDALFGEENLGRSFMELIDNPEEFLTQQVRILYHEWQPCQEEEWCKMLLERQLKHPLFQKAWEEASRNASSALAARRAQYDLRLRIPLRLRYQQEKPEDPNVLVFHVYTEPFVEDRRFRIVCFQPSDVPTLRLCLEWAEAKP